MRHEIKERTCAAAVQAMTKLSGWSVGEGKTDSQLLYRPLSSIFLLIDDLSVFFTVCVKERNQIYTLSSFATLSKGSCLEV